MAINFPDSPIEGTTYDYLGVRYIWKDTGGGTGLWTVTTPGTYGAASTAEVNTGTDPVKYISPKALADSYYLTQFDHAIAEEVNAGVSNVPHMTPLSIAGSDYRKTKYWQPETSVFFYGSGSGGQNVDRIINLILHPGMKFALIRIILLQTDPGGGTESFFKVWPHGEDSSLYPYNTWSLDEHGHTEPFWVKVGTLERLYIRWSQFATAGVGVNILAGEF